MKIKPAALLCAIIFGIAFHAAGIFWIHSFPINFQQKIYENAARYHNPHFDTIQRQQRTAFLTEFFDQITPQEPKGKLAFHELRAEYAPHLELLFPSPCLSDPIMDFSFETSQTTAIEFPHANTLPNPYMATNAGALQGQFLPIPPLADVYFEDEQFYGVDVLAGSEHFDIQVEYAPKRSRPGYVFKITLLPRADVTFKRICQNYYFLLDRSNSIPRGRYQLNKKAVAAALAFLKPDDKFNILVFDDRVVRFQENAVVASAEAVESARIFLDRQGHGGFFAATELYASLGKIIPQNISEHEVNTAILFSDGDTYLSLENQRQTIGRWTAHNYGKVALFTIASGTGNNLPLLELLSSFNKGALIYAQDHQDLEARLSYLMRVIQNPIGKQMVATAVCEDKAMSVFLQPKNTRLPDLYQHRPYVIYGTTNKLCDFVLFLQGRYYDEHFDIKKKICFSDAKLGAYSIERGWTQLLVQEFYERYFQEGNPAHLEIAKQLLLPLNLPTPLIE